MVAIQRLSRRIGVVVPNFQMVPALLQGSDIIASLPSRVLADFRGLVAFPPADRGVRLFPALAWYRRRAKDVALQHAGTILTTLLR